MSPDASRVLFICTGNMCRSPMAAAALRSALEPGRDRMQVESAGFVTSGRPCPPEVLDVMVEAGFDLSGHRSRVVNAAIVEGTALIVGMTKQHVVELVASRPAAWSRCFTFAEVLRLGEAVEHRFHEESLPGWVYRIGAGRTQPGLTQLPLNEDIPDPMGGSRKDYVRARETIIPMARRLATLLRPI